MYIYTYVYICIKIYIGPYKYNCIHIFAYMYICIHLYTWHIYAEVAQALNTPLHA